MMVSREEISNVQSAVEAMHIRFDLLLQIQELRDEYDQFFELEAKPLRELLEYAQEKANSLYDAAGESK
jgi:hypothetical protein